MTATVAEVLSKKPRHVVPVPQWDDTVIVRRMSADERCKLESAKMDPRTIRRSLLEMVVINEDGSPWATSDEWDALFAAEGSAPPLEVIFDAALKFNALTQDAREDIAKN